MLTQKSESIDKIKQSEIEKSKWIVLNGGSGLLKDFLSKNKMLVHERYDNGDTALLLSAMHGRTEIARKLLAAGAEVDAENDFGTTALLRASYNEKIDMVKLLLKKNASIKKTNSRGEGVLHRAACNKNMELIRLLVNKGAPINVRDHYGKTVLAYAADNMELARFLLDNGASMDKKDNTGDTILFYAVRANKKAFVDLLLHKAASVNKQHQDDGSTVLHIAAKAGHVAVLKLLLERGASANIKDKNGYTPLHWAVKNKSVEIVTLLLTYQKDLVNEVNEKECGRTTLHYAVEGDIDPALIKLLVEAGITIDKPDDNGETALYYASSNGRLDIVRLLLNFLIGREEHYDSNILHDAMHSGDVRLVESLIDKEEISALLNEKNETGAAALMLASNYGYKEVVASLLRKKVFVIEENDDDEMDLLCAFLFGEDNAMVEMLLKANPSIVNIKDDSGSAALHLAVLIESTKMVELLLEHGASINIKDENNYTPLHLAVKKKPVEAFKLLMNFYMRSACVENVDTKLIQFLIKEKTLLEFVVKNQIFIWEYNNNGDAVPCSRINFIESEEAVDLMLDDEDFMLHYPLSNGNSDIVRLLLEHGASIDAKDSNGNTVLHDAAYNGNVQILNLLLEKNVEVNRQNNSGLTALHFVVQGGCLDAVKLLLSHNASISLQDNDGDTVLHYAAIDGNSEMLSLLLNNKAKIDDLNNKKMTPLHCTVSNKHLAAVKLLLSHNASIDKQDNDGQTVLHYAAENGSANIVKLLLKKEDMINVDIHKKNKAGYSAILLADKNGHHDIVSLLVAHSAIQAGHDAHDISSSWHIVKTLTDFNTKKSRDIAVAKKVTDPKNNKEINSSIECWLIDCWKKILKLPSEYQLDKTTPFNQIEGSYVDNAGQWMPMLHFCEHYYGISMQNVQENTSVQWLAKFIHKKVMQSESMIPWCRYKEDHNKKQSGLFFIHPIFGGIGGLDKTAEEIDKDILKEHNISMYLYASPLRKLAYDSAEFDAACEAFCDIEYQAKLAVNAIQAVQPHGSYYLCGWSYGGVLTVEIARQLHERGEKIKHIGLIDPKMPAQLRAYTPEELFYRISRHLDYICQAMLGEGNQPDWKSIWQKVATLDTGPMLVNAVFNHVLAQLKAYEDKSKDKYASLVKAVKICKANYIATLRYETNEKLKDAKLPPVTVYVAGKTPENWCKQEYSLDDCVDLTEKRIEEKIIDGTTHVEIVEHPKFIQLLTYYLKNAAGIKQANKLSQVIEKCHRNAIFSQYQIGDNDAFFDVSACEVAQCRSSDGGDIDTFLTGNTVQQGLLRGNAGAGKSLLARKLVLANLADKTSRQKRWVFYIPMHAALSYTDALQYPLRESNCVESLLYHHYGKSSGMSYEQVKYAWEFIKKNPESICFILDKPSDVIANKILESMLKFLFNQDFSLLVVNRDYQLNLLRQLDFSASVTFTMQPMNDDQVRRLIQQYFKRLKQVSDGDALLVWLQDYPALQDFCKTPLHLSMLCSIWSQLKDESYHDDISTLFDKIINKMIRRYWEDEGIKEQWIINESTQDNIQDETNDVLQFLQYSAYHSLIDASSTISPQQMSQWLQQFKNNQGLFMKALRSGFIVPLGYAVNDIERYCEFSNPSIQLYLACQYFYRELATLSHEQLTSGSGKALWHFVRRVIEQYPMDLLRAFIVMMKSDMLTDFLCLLNCHADNVYSLPLLTLISHSVEASFKIGEDNSEREVLVKRIGAVFYYANGPFSRTYSVNNQRDTPDVATEQLSNYKEQVNVLAEQCPRLIEAIMYYIENEKNTAERNNVASAYDYQAGENGIHFTIKIKDKALLSVLLTLGADTEKRSDKGISPMKTAYDNQFTEGFNLIKQQVKLAKQQRFDASLKQLYNTCNFWKKKPSATGQSTDQQQWSQNLLGYLNTLIQKCDEQDNMRDVLCQRIQKVREDVVQQYLFGQKVQCLGKNKIDDYLLNLLHDYTKVKQATPQTSVIQKTHFFEVNACLTDRSKELMACLKDKEVVCEATITLLETNQCDGFKQHLHGVYVEIKSILYKEYRTVHDSFKEEVVDVFSEDEYCQFLDNTIAKLSRGDLTDQGLAHDVKVLVKNKLAPLLCEDTDFVETLLWENKALLLTCLLKRYREKLRLDNGQVDLADGLEKLLKFAYSQCYGNEIKREVVQNVVNQCQTSSKDSSNDDESMIALLKKAYADFNNKRKRAGNDESCYLCAMKK